MTVALYEDFANPLGEFTNYDSYDAGQLTQLDRQKHVDIRSFQSPVYTPYTMYALSTLAMSVLDSFTMATFADLIVTPGENWTQGTVGPQSDINHFNGLSLSCGIGATSTSSVIAPIDISSFAPTDSISVAVPSLQAANLTLASCFVDLTSNPTGNFATGPTDSLAFSTSTSALPVATNYPATNNYPSSTNYPADSDYELRFPISALTHVALNSITGVRFRIQATQSCTFRCLAVRALASTWDYAPIDQNTLYGRLGATVPLDAATGLSYTFPTASPPVTPADWPITFFSDGAGGPRLVDVEIGAVIQTGASQAQNTFSLYFREAELQTMPMSLIETKDMSDLLILGQMPGTVPGTEDNFSQAQFLIGTLQWGTSTSISIGDNIGTPYTVSGSLAPNTSYYLLWTLRGNSLRGRVYRISTNGLVDWGALALDSTTVTDTSLIRRRRGRLGWYAQLKDGNAYVTDLRPRRSVYAEYRSAPFTSYTPVEGARLYTEASPDVNLYPGSIATPGTRISPDTTKSTSGKCIRVQCDGNRTLEGLSASAPVRFENFFDTELRFDVLAPSSVKLVAVLIGEDRIIPISLPAIPNNAWTHVTLSFETLGSVYLPGPYTLLILQPVATQNLWYIDNLALATKAISWEGRGQAADPWGMNNPPWIKFGDQINTPHDGALLGRGNALQVRGQALTPTAAITRLKILPKYAELGDFVWADEAPNYTSYTMFAMEPLSMLALEAFTMDILSNPLMDPTIVAPIPAFTASQALSPPHTVSCDGSASTAAHGLVQYYWTFGDGTYAYGQPTTHTYALPGTYTVCLTVIDNLNQKVAITHNVTIT